MRRHCYKHEHCCGFAAVHSLIKKILYNTNSTWVYGPADLPLIPDPDQPDTANQKIYVGCLFATPISSINEAVVKQLNTLEYGDYSKYQIDVTDPYQFVTVAVPQGKKVFVDNGIGEKTAFYSTANVNGEPWYCNGEKQIMIDDAIYNVYGLYTAGTGLIYIYIE